MEAIARLKYQRGSVKRARLVADLIRNKNVNESKDILYFSKKRVARIISKLLDAAISNAVSKEGKVEIDKLIINEIFVDNGVTMKRYRHRARGRADMIRKRTCYITLSVSDEKYLSETEEVELGSKN